MTEVGDSTVSRDFVVINELGMHVRPATTLAILALEHEDTDVFLTSGDKTVNAKTPLLVLTLANVKGTHYTVSANGPHAEEVVESIVAAAARKFDVKGD